MKLTHLISVGVLAIFAFAKEPKASQELLDEWDSLYHQANILFEDGFYMESEEKFEEALKILQESDAIDDMRKSFIYSQIQLVYVNLCRVDKMDYITNKYYRLYETSNTKEDIDLIIIMNNMSVAQAAKGNHEEALRYIQKAYDIYSEYPDSYPISYKITLKNHLAERYINLGNLKPAETLLIEIENIIKNDSEWMDNMRSDFLDKKALLYEKMGDFDAAVFSLKSEIRLLNDKYSKKSKWMVNYHPEIGFVYARLSMFYQKIYHSYLNKNNQLDADAAQNFSLGYLENALYIFDGRLGKKNPLSLYLKKYKNNIIQGKDNNNLVGEDCYYLFLD